MSVRLTSSIEVKVDRKTKATMSFDHIIDNEEEAYEKGIEDARILTAYSNGFAGEPR